MKHFPPAASRSTFFHPRLARPFLAAVGIALLLPACASRQPYSNKYTAIRVSNYRGETISEYVARGPVVPVEGGYQIHAVERQSSPPYQTYTRYPFGWDATVVGPRIQQWPVAKPAWLDESHFEDSDSPYAK